MIKREIKEEFQSAYHNAGHAVIAWVLNVPVEKVSIISTGGHLGETVVNWNDKADPSITTFLDQEKMECEFRAMVSLAGYLSEKHFVQNTRIKEKKSAYDIHQANEVIRTILGVNEDEKCTRNYFNHLESITEKIFSFRNVEISIKAVAGALIEKRTLSGKEISSIIFDEIKKEKEKREQENNDGNVIKIKCVQHFNP